MANPAPRVLLGSSKKPGIFSSSGKPAKEAAQLCQEQHWIEGTDQFEGKGKTRKELYRITPAGVHYALSHAEPVQLLQAIHHHLDSVLPSIEAACRGLQEQAK